MIIKTMSRKAHIGRTIAYVFKDKAKLQTSTHQSVTVRKNLRSRNLDTMIKEFEANEQLRKYTSKNAVRLYHTVVSFHEKDSPYLDKETLITFAREYMKLRGPNMYIAVAHYDRQSHIHLHICESGTQYLTGRANRMTKKEYHDLKIAMQSFQTTKFPLLTNSIPAHGKRFRKEKEQSILQNRESHKQELITLIERAERKANSQADLFQSIEQAGHTLYYRSGKLAGIKYNKGRKFRFSRLGYTNERLQSIGEQLQTRDQLRQIRNKAQNKYMEQEQIGNQDSKEAAPEIDND